MAQSNAFNQLQFSILRSQSLLLECPHRSNFRHSSQPSHLRSNYFPHNSNQPVLFVLKKNGTSLENLISWLRTYNMEGANGTIDLPMLLIDDEADNASVNTRATSDPTKINKLIRTLLNLFRRSSYVGVTATPFANIFIEPETTDEMLKDDLFSAPLCQNSCRTGT